MGNPFSEREVWLELEDEDEEGEVFEIEMSTARDLETRKIRAFQARCAEQMEEERVQAFRQKIFEDFDGKVLDTEVPREPPKPWWTLWNGRDLPETWSPTDATKGVDHVRGKIGSP